MTNAEAFALDCFHRLKILTKAVNVNTISSHHKILVESIHVMTRDYESKLADQYGEDRSGW